VLSRDKNFNTIEATIPTTTPPAVGSFTVNLMGLESGIQYWVKSFAFIAGNSLSNSGTYYGNPVSFTAGNPVFKIGQEYDGGIIFYLDATNQHGLMCAKNDQGLSAWDPFPFDVNNSQNYSPQFTGAISTSMGTGFANTTMITGIIGTGFDAAGLCTLYRDEKNHDDWYLPSKGELNAIYENLVVPGIITPSSLNSSYYWSSSEIDNKDVWSQRFDDGQPVNFAWKNNIMNVRAVRAF